MAAETVKTKTEWLVSSLAVMNHRLGSLEAGKQETCCLVP
jgi:hypothetical protein